MCVGTEVFNGSFGDLESFVPKKLNRTMIFSKNNSLFDILGKFVPVMVDLKMDLRKAVQLTEGWKDPVPEELRSKWIKNFWKLETLRGIKFERARMPLNAVSTKMDLITAGDAAQSVKIAGSWGRFRLNNGHYSCQLILGRSLLADEDTTIPKNELSSLTMAANLSWILRQALEKWVDSHILIGDSTISLCWVSSDKKRLSLYHRNRTVQIRRAVEDLGVLYHVVSQANPADCGTRPNSVKEEHVGPNSIWERGLPWMTGEIDEAVAQGILTPIANLRLNEEEEKFYNDGLVYEKSPEILTRGHTVLLASRVEKVKLRVAQVDYLISPNKFKFVKIVRILAIVMKFVRSFKCVKGKLGRDNDVDTKFQMFSTFCCVKSNLKEPSNDIEESEVRMSSITAIIRLLNENEKNQVFEVFDTNYIKKFIKDKSDTKETVVDIHRIALIDTGVKDPGIKFKGKCHVLLNEDDVSKALEYLFRKETEIVKEFNKAELLRKISVERSGILFSRSRILDGQRFQVAGGLEEQDILTDFNIKLLTPLLDRYSPLSYSIGDHIHNEVAKHGGYETCYRESLNHVFIIQGLSLFRELGEDCTKCARKRKKCIDVSMGSISDEQLTIAPAFYITMLDIFGPCKVFVPGHAMKTRHRNIVEAKCYILVFACPVTKAVNLQVIEEKGADGVLDGVNRLGCEVGFPSFLLVDQDSGILKALKEAKVELMDLQFLFQKERDIKFKTCPVSGHNFHGLVERKIRSVQECLEECGFDKMKLHATGLQTVMKLIENDINNLPMGFSYGRDSNNSPLLKLIFPNMLRTGRMNRRALNGPVRLPKGPGELLEKIEKSYEVFFKLWNTTVIPKLMKQNKWFNSMEELKVNDIVYFRKEESELSSKWTVGKVVNVVRSKDGMVRRATIEYQNSTEDFARTTDRAVRSLIKICNMDDNGWQEDMSKVEKLLEAMKDNNCDDTSVSSITRLDDGHSEQVEQFSDESSNEYVMSYTGVRLKYRLCRLAGVSGYSDVVALGRKVGVQHIPGAKNTKKKFVKPCEFCCCSYHCNVLVHEVGSVEVDMPTQQVEFPSMLDRSYESRRL